MAQEVDPVKDGIDLGKAVQQLVENSILAARPGNASMGDLAAAVDHITANAARWQNAALYLAAQLHTARTVSDAQRARDADFTLNGIRRSLAIFDRDHGDGA